KHGYSEELDSYIEAKYSGKNWIAHYQTEERASSGIPSLKVGFNSVFGYYIEITKTHKDKVPEHYDRKQTLTNAERYITPALKEIETKILSAEEKIAEIEHSLFTELLSKVAEFASVIQGIASKVADTDCHQSFAESAREYDFSEPQIDESEVLIIKNGRHPVVERLLGIGESFTPNDTNLDPEEEQIHIITGPNMSGKSCYLRQVALVVLLGQIGSFVPADSAKFGLVDRIFTRVGAQDNITAGESTFLVEMQEAANIMNNATQKSLILLDEVGRGTATFDGISIAWSIAEYIHNSIGAKTLFATHYHELNDLADRYERIVNYKVEVLEAGSTVIFSHKVMPGASDHSFGIHVARMAGMPDEIIGRADIIMKSFEEYSNSGETKQSDDEASVSSKTADTGGIKTQKASRVPEQLSIFELRDDPLREQLIKIEVDNLTPIEALQVLSKMRKDAVKGKNRR
ncbi:MAG: DNA mismatch repair protein MutS, partial [Chlorobi bacterium]|nr:DNA mismatch repair protein MutS [Chlorobiota bacterium]